MAYYLNQPPPQVAIDLAKGQTYLEQFVFAVDGTPFDFTGATIVGEIWSDVAATGTKLADFTVSSDGAGGALDDTGVIFLGLTDETTGAFAIPSGTGARRAFGYPIVQCTYADGTADTLLIGSVTLTVMDT